MTMVTGTLTSGSSSAPGSNTTTHDESAHTDIGSATPAPQPAPTSSPKTVKLSVPLDSIKQPPPKSSHLTTTVHGQHRLMRRDSLERREAVLKGKEGSRQRRRWENDRLLNNPWAEPPLPSDWEVRPTHPRRTIPYYLAPLWDAAEFQRSIERKIKGRRNSVRHGRKRGTVSEWMPGLSPFEEEAANIPKEIRSRLRHARSAKGLLQDLEQEVRKFVEEWNQREMKLRLMEERGEAPSMQTSLTLRPRAIAVPEPDADEDDDIVFVGRNGQMSDLPASPSSTPPRQLQLEPGQDTRSGLQSVVKRGTLEEHEQQSLLATSLLLSSSLESDKSAAFTRWLVHCVGTYYGLRTWSVTRSVEGEVRREAYIGVDERTRGWMGRGVEVGREIELPQPLWGMV